VACKEIPWNADEVPMNSPRPHLLTSLDQRRSQRLALTVPVNVSGRLANGENFTADASTLVVNAHGALIVLAEAVQIKQALNIRDIRTGEQLPCEVCAVNTNRTGAREVAVEFLQPSPRFWRVTFPPEDWTPRHPEAKRFDSKKAVSTKHPSS
jgi:hypothetical protein